MALVFLGFLWELFKTWIHTFYVSFTNGETIWIIIPIWLSWFFAEFFQEKKGTSFGNAISNGIVPLWVGIDWIRTLTSQLVEKKTVFGFIVFGKYLISVIVLIYGLFIIINGIKGRSFVRYIGRIREVTYVLAIFTPFVYGEIEPSYRYFLSFVLFFPLFYFLVELMDRLIPTPQAYEEDKKQESGPKYGPGNL